MTPWHPTRREFIATAPLVLGASALPAPLLAADPKPLRFFVIGDWGREGWYWQRPVAAAMAARQDRSDSRASFVVSTGDNFYLLGVTSTSDPKWERSFERIYSKSLDRWYPVLGNHDYGGFVEAQIDYSGKSDRWIMPSRWHTIRLTDLGRPDVQLFFIDTVAWIGSEGRFYRTVRSSTVTRVDQLAQCEWLDRELAKAAPIRLVFGHHAIYSISAHGGAKELKELDALLRHHRVAAYINGHDHGMYHVRHEGMHYICSGAGSEVLPHYTGHRDTNCVLPDRCGDKDPRWQSFLGNSPYENFDLDGGFAAFELHPRHIEFEFIDGYNQRRYWNWIGLPAAPTQVDDPHCPPAASTA